MADLDDIDGRLSEVNLTLVGVNSAIFETNKRLDMMIELMEELVQITAEK